MLQHAAKWALLWTLWRKAKPYAASTGFAALGFLLITLAHGEFLAYAVHTESRDHVPLSYVLKWTAYLLVIGGYCLALVSIRRRQQAEPPPAPAPVADDGLPTDDRLESLRNRDRLRSRGDQILDRKRAEQATSRR